MDGERGYNSSHCIGSLRVIGTLPAFYPFLSVSLSPDSLLPPSYASLPTVVSHFTKASSARYYARYAAASPFYIAIAANCIASARFLLFRFYRNAISPTDQSIFPPFDYLFPIYQTSTNYTHCIFSSTIETVDKFEMIAFRGLLTSRRWRRVVSILRSR